MDPSFYGLEGHPFESTTAPDAAAILAAHEGIVTELDAGLTAPHGITLLIGAEGTGKSSLVSAFASRVAESCAVAFLPSTGPGLRHLLTEIIEQLGGSAPASGEEAELLESLRTLARGRAEHGRVTLIVIDDAHELPAKTIERLGRLFGDDAAEPSRLHMILVGREELLNRMNAANDRAILKHLVQVCRMDPIGPEQAVRYIAGRVQRVGGDVDSLFTQDALRLIINRAGGNPQRIDELCAAALEHGEESGARPVGPDAVDLACGEAGRLAARELESAGSDSGGYVFDDDDDDDDDGGDDGDAPSNRPRRQNRPRRSASKKNKKARGKAGGGGGTRRSLALAAGGLVTVLAVFAVTMTDTKKPSAGLQPPAGAGGLETASGKSVPPASRKATPAADKVGSRKDRKVAPKAALPSKPVATPKLVVKRTPVAAAPAPVVVRAPTRPPDRTAAAAPVHAAPRPKPPTPAPAAARPPAPVAARPAPAATRAPAPPPVVAIPQAPAAPRPAARPAAPVPATPARVAAATPAPPTPAPVKTAAPAAPVRSAAATPAPVSTGRAFTVQVGAFKSRANADTLRGKIEGQFPDARVVQATVNGSAVYRVFSGSFASKSDAEGRASALTRGGFNTYVRLAP